MNWLFVAQIAATLAEYAIAMLFFKDFLGQRKDNKIMAISGAFLYTITLMLASILLPDMGFVNALLLLPLLILFSFLMFDSNRRWKLFASALFFTLTLSIDIATEFIIVGINGTNASDIVEGDSAIFRLIFSKVLLVLAAKAIGKLRNKQNRRLAFRHWVAMAIFPITSSVVLYVLFVTNRQLEQTEITFHMIVALVGILAMNIIAVRFIEILSDKAEQEAREIILMKNYEMTTNECKILEYTLASNANLLHDMKFHMPTLAKLTDERKIDDALKIMQTILKSEYKKTKEYVQTSNSVVNAIFNYYIGLAAQHNIKVDVGDIFFPNNLKIDLADLCTIFGNSLENAIEACTKVNSDEKNIVVRLRYSENKLTYSVANPTNGNVIKGRKWFRSTKTTAGLKGIGIEAMERAVQKYGGTFGAYHKDNIFKIMFVISKNQ